ncbi:MAG: hypothetical protein AABX90_03600, partial [Nanoarchaeota archaeon]
MDRESRILIGSVFIIVLVAISFNFSFTGSVVSDNPKVMIDISPEIVTPGEVIYVDISPGIEGINNRADFVYAIDDLRKGSKTLICGEGTKCLSETSFSYVIPQSWESGVYYVAIFDYDSG